jgi:hypothetical protein
MATPVLPPAMLSAVAFVWGILAVIGMVVGFIPCLSAWNWLNIPFAVIGATIGIISIFTRKEGGSRYAVIGIALCMLASIVGLLRLVTSQGSS